MRSKCLSGLQAPSQASSAPSKPKPSRLLRHLINEEELSFIKLTLYSSSSSRSNMNKIPWNQLKREMSPLISLNSILKNRIARKVRQEEERGILKMMRAGQIEGRAMTRMVRLWGWGRVLNI
jgi:hypothetical protein